MNDRHHSPEPSEPRHGADAISPTLTPAQRLAWDACQAGTDETVDPECAPLAALLAQSDRWRAAFQRARQYDERIRSAMHAADVPVGLESRILARLANAEALAASAQSTATANESPADELQTTTAPQPLEPAVLQLPPRRQHTSRRRWLWGAAALAASVMAVLLIWPPQPADLTPDSVHALARQIFLDEQSLAQSDATGASTLWTEAQPADPAYAFPAMVRRSADLRWREVNGFLNRDGVAYDWTSRNGRRATLYVVPLAAGRGQPRVLPVGYSRPPRRSLSTQGQATAAWTSDDCLFVLVVEGSERDYQSLLIPSGQAA